VTQDSYLALEIASEYAARAWKPSSCRLAPALTRPAMIGTAERGLQLSGKGRAILAPLDRYTPCDQGVLVARGWVEPPTFRFKIDFLECGPAIPETVR
jgi:hypothetical protein